MTELTFLIVSLPDEDEVDIDDVQTVVYYTRIKRALNSAESLLFQACTDETSRFYADEYNTRGGGTKSMFAEYLLGRYMNADDVVWRKRILKPKLSSVDPFWQEEIRQRCSRLPKHDVLIAAPAIKECIELEGYVERLDNLLFEWKEEIKARKDKQQLTESEINLYVLEIDDFCDESEEDSSNRHSLN